MLQEKWQKKAHIYIRQYVHIEIFEKIDMKQVLIQKQLDSTDLSATNKTFVTKGEFERNF